MSVLRVLVAGLRWAGVVIPTVAAAARTPAASGSKGSNLAGERGHGPILTDARGVGKQTHDGNDTPSRVGRTLLAGSRDCPVTGGGASAQARRYKAATRPRLPGPAIAATS